MNAQQKNKAATILIIAIIMLTCSHFVGAQNIRRLDAPAGAFVELSTGERRTLADLLAKHAWALKDSDSSGAPGVWCCVPVWNGRSRAEMWANVVAVAANSPIALSTDPNCATRVCDQLPVTVPAFVNLCPQTLPCGSGSAQGMNGPIHDGGNSSSSASTSALPRPPPPSPPPPPPPPPSPQPDAVPSSSSSNAGGSSNNIKANAANGPPPPSPSVAGRLDVVVLPAEVVARSSGGGSRRGAPSIISSALLFSVVAGVPLLLS
jgi:hypothetical protein